MTVNERMKSVRTQEKLSMEAFGELIGMSKSNVSKLEKGEHNVAERNIKLICSEFNINENWLRTGEGEMFNSSEDNREFRQLIVSIEMSDHSELKNGIILLSELNDHQRGLMINIMKEMRKVSSDN